MLTIDNVTVKNIAKLVLRYFLMRKGHFKKVKKKNTNMNSGLTLFYS